MLIAGRLPDVDGLDVCRRVRKHDPSAHSLMLTARGQELDIVVGLAAGAVDAGPSDPSLTRVSPPTVNCAWLAAQQGMPSQPLAP